MSPVSSAKVRRISSQNEQSWQTLDIGNVFKPTSGFKNSQFFQFKKQIYQILCGPPDFNLPTWVKIAPPYTSIDLVQNLLSDRL